MAVMTNSARRTAVDVPDEVTEDPFLQAVVDGLSRSRKAIPSKFFYDAEGSRLFERICELDEYYPTRTELAILDEQSDALASLLPECAVLVEFGSGASVKVRLLLDALDQPAGYVPIDISREHLLNAAAHLATDYPALTVAPVHADFAGPFGMPDDLPAGPRVGFFPGSTIGNFHPAEAVAVLQGFAEALDGRGQLLIGVDLKKDPRTLNAAYNDAAGITAAFNLNLLARINRELDGSFDLAGFRHHATYNAAAGRVEMHLVSQREQQVRIAGRCVHFRAGERIHTENSYKYTLDEFRLIAVAAGYTPVAAFTDPRQLFSVHLLEVGRS